MFIYIYMSIMFEIKKNKHLYNYILMTERNLKKILGYGILCVEDFIEKFCRNLKYLCFYWNSREFNNF